MLPPILTAVNGATLIPLTALAVVWFLARIR